VHCGPGGIYVAALGSMDGKAPGGIFMIDHESFEPLGRHNLASDILGMDVISVVSENGSNGRGRHGDQFQLGQHSDEIIKHPVAERFDSPGLCNLRRSFGAEDS
jgi:hypothetical protein